MIKPDNKKSLSIALKKARGNLNNIEKMVEEDRYCLDVAQQLNATLGILRNANATILKNHLQTCGGQKLASRDEKIREEFIEELVRTFDVSSRK